MKLNKDPSVILKDVFGGKGQLKVWTLIEKSKLRPFVTVFSCELEAGAYSGEIEQKDYPEILVVLEGEGEFVVNQQIFSATSGACLEVDVGDKISVKNMSGSKPLRYLIVKAQK